MVDLIFQMSDLQPGLLLPAGHLLFSMRLLFEIPHYSLSLGSLGSAATVAYLPLQYILIFTMTSSVGRNMSDLYCIPINKETLLWKNS